MYHFNEAKPSLLMIAAQGSPGPGRVALVFAITLVTHGQMQNINGNQKCTQCTLGKSFQGTSLQKYHKIAILMVFKTTYMLPYAANF